MDEEIIVQIFEMTIIQEVLLLMGTEATGESGGNGGGGVVGAGKFRW